MRRQEVTQLLLVSLSLLPSSAVAGPGLGVAVQDKTGPGGWGWASTANCTWKYITQPLDHFGSTPHTFQERYCIYDKFWAEAQHGGFSGTDEMAPIFFYTGNESPIEPYVNNTGLMWNLGKEMHALIVFAEHRYEGNSLPPLDGVGDCVTYGTTAQALADYTALVTQLKIEYATEAPVVAFGGSYGGMLAGWARIVAPQTFIGSIAASAPVRMIMSSDTFRLP